jgi:hypothetical protein
MTEQELSAVIRGIAPVVRAFVAKASDTVGAGLQMKFAETAPLLGTIATLTTDLHAMRARVEALEAATGRLDARPTMKFCGVWRAGTTHTPGDAVMHQRSLWVCKAETPGEPSKDFVGWQLAFKAERRPKPAPLVVTP